ncbi:MAG: nitroreductase [SAR86 cluster bacterium]|mgnify:FL=1|uniref:Putative NAD(P)H nitroreductase n=1 Tax=SAR86 cluster bacterium TaxID=2030880 RepID=A0A520MXN4_9GAMM|nr:nitroreductase [SAR86 cluster bacterium]RZO25939.1 MAG: nitroreductase [SAR86 cluster bacterium]
MNEALKNIVERNSHRNLEHPIPSDTEMQNVYKAALRAPDHAWLRPSSFIEVQGKGLEKLSQVFVDFAKENIKNLDDAKLEKYKNAPFRAPMVIVLINTPKEHPMVPEIEQVMSTAAAGQNILLALSAMGFGGIWRTGSFALNDKIGKFLGLDQGQNVVGYLYVGTPKGDPKRLPEVNVSDFVTKWND